MGATTKNNTYKEGLQENALGEVSPDYGTTAQPVGATNAPGSANKMSREDHSHGHGNQTSGTMHAIVTNIVNGFMSAVDKIKLNNIQNSYMQYRMGADVTQSGTGFTPINTWTINENSKPLTYFSKPDNQVFRALVAMQVEIYCQIELDSNNNNTGGYIEAIFNPNGVDTVIPGAWAGASVRSNINESIKTSFRKIIDLAANDEIGFEVGNREGNNITAESGNGCSMMCIRLMRLL